MSEPEKTKVTMLLDMEAFQDPEHIQYTKILLERAGYEVSTGSIEAHMARGRVPDCDCGLIECCCTAARAHKEGCRLRLAMTCAIEVTCDHGLGVCSECDPCTCSAIP